ncbi:hypothetical protein AMS68_007376 [Peltaster fructicola]|uniref:DUF7730 domain-containing protein n=1 Tax=Peltaster fructicola TaxID=286661 RepID=A0A6H0Y4U0_9PEZI|nr:hypothetical protein AMS68_007376 [Peltaster fructicola]
MAALLFGAYELVNWTCKKIGSLEEFSQRRLRSERRLEPQLRPLKSKRDDGWSLKAVHEQQCALFKIVSQDVRLIIWTLVLGREEVDDVIHLDLGEGSIRSRRCLNNEQLKELGEHLDGRQLRMLERSLTDGHLDDLGFKHICWDISWTKQDRKKRPDLIAVPDHRLLLPLVTTCKQIYNESIHILYAANTFDVRRAECLLRLPKVIPLQHLDSIRSLRFSTAFQYPIYAQHAQANNEILRTRAWSPPDDAAKWPEACRVLSSMRLECLDITLALWVQQPKWTEFDDDVEESIFNVLRPLTNIRVSKFQVALTADVPQAVLSRLGSIPFAITKDNTTDAGFEFGIHQTFSPSS